LRVGKELYADGAAVVVFIDMQAQKPVRIPERIRSLLLQ
jgi:acyl-CoA thioesterase FadM